MGSGYGQFCPVAKALEVLDERWTLLVVRELVAECKGTRYVLTAAGQELRPVVEALGAWGIRWITELAEEDHDPSLLLWDMHRRVDRGAVPPGRTVLEFRFVDAADGARDWWLVMQPEDVEVCDVDPGYDVAVTLRVGLRRMTEIWRGDLDWATTVRIGALELDGPTALRGAVPRWFVPVRYAQVPRPA